MNILILPRLRIHHLDRAVGSQLHDYSFLSFAKRAGFGLMIATLCIASPEVTAYEEVEEIEAPEEKTEEKRRRAQKVASDSASGKDVNFLEIAVYVGENFNIRRSEYSLALEDYNRSHGWQQQTRTFFPDAGIDVLYGNHTWQFGIGAGLLSVYENVAIVQGQKEIEKFSMLNAQILTKYFLSNGWYVGFDAGMAFSLSTFNTSHHPAVLKSLVYPVVTLKTGYEQRVTDSPVTLGLFLESAYFFASMTDDLDNGIRSYQVSNWNLMPAFEVAYSFQ